MSNQETPVQEDPVVELRLTLSAVNLVLGHLAQGKFADVAGTLESVRVQASTQLQARAAAAQAAAQPAAEGAAGADGGAQG